MSWCASIVKVTWDGCSACSAEAAIAGAFDATFRDSAAPLTQGEAAEALARFDAIMPTLGDRFDAAAFAGPAPRTRGAGQFRRGL